MGKKNNFSYGEWMYRQQIYPSQAEDNFGDEVGDVGDMTDTGEEEGTFDDEEVDYTPIEGTPEEIQAQIDEVLQLLKENMPTAPPIA